MPAGKCFDRTLSLRVSPPPFNTLSVKCALRYLEACNKLFERGFLSHERITSEHSQVLKNIDIGMSFFNKWLDCLKKGTLIKHVIILTVKNYTCVPYYFSRPIIRFQGPLPEIVQLLCDVWCTLILLYSDPFSSAWDNMRILTAGFKLLCKDFIARYPDYFISPLRVSGSSVETLFAQYKHLSGNKLDSVNYTTARAKYLCNKSVVASHHSGKYYWDMPLNVPKVQLHKKKYGNRNWL